MIQKLPAPTEISRVETGAIQFGDDWPGYFIRGDNVATLLMYMDDYKKGNTITDTCFESMMEDLKSALIWRIK